MPKYHYECPAHGYVDPDDKDADEPTCPECGDPVDVLVETVSITEVDPDDAEN